MTRFRWIRAAQPWWPFGLRGRGRRGARFLPGLDGPMGMRAPADRDPVPLPRSGQAEHTNGNVRPRRLANAARRPREYLTAEEVERLITAARSRPGRYGHRDA